MTKNGSLLPLREKGYDEGEVECCEIYKLTSFPAKTSNPESNKVPQEYPRY